MNAIIRKESVVLHSLGENLSGMFFLPEVAGRVPALIVCHGAGEFKENYFELCEFLARNGIASLALDMHGHGESGGERFHVEMPQWVADIRSALDFLLTREEVDAGRTGALGLSSGGTAVLEAAMVDNRLKFLVPLDATVQNSMPWPISFILSVLLWTGRMKKRFVKKELRVSLMPMFSFMKVASDPDINAKLKANPRARAAFMAFPFPGAEDSFFVDTIKRAHKISVPTMLVWGEDDEIEPPKNARQLFNILTCKKRLHIIPGNGHVGHLDRNRQKVFELTRDWVLENTALETVTAAHRAGVGG